MRTNLHTPLALAATVLVATAGYAAECPHPTLPPGQEAAIQAALQPDAQATGLVAGDMQVQRDRIAVRWSDAAGARFVYAIGHGASGQAGMRAGVLRAVRLQPCPAPTSADPLVVGLDGLLDKAPQERCPPTMDAVDAAFARAMQRLAAAIKWQCNELTPRDANVIAAVQRTTIGGLLRQIDDLLRVGDQPSADFLVEQVERQAAATAMDLPAQLDFGLAMARLHRKSAPPALSAALARWQPAWQLASQGTDTQALVGQVVVTERAAAAQAALGQLDQAAATLQLCWKLVPQGSCSALPLADVLEQTGHAELAEQLLDQQLKREVPPRPEFFRARIGLASRRDDARVELRTAEAAVAAYPTQLDLQESLASACFRSGQHLCAVRLLEKIYQGNPKHPGVLGRLSGVVNDWGRVDPPREGQVSGWQQLRDEMQKRALTDGNDVVAQFLYGVSQFYDAKFASALAQMRKVEPFAPNEGRVYIYQAMAHLWLGHPELATALADKAVAANPHDPDVYYCQSQVLRQTDKPAAVRALERYLAMELAPGSLHFAKKTKRVQSELALLRAGQMPPLWDKPGHYDDEDGPTKVGQPPRPKGEQTVAEVIGSLKMWLIVGLGALIFIGGGTWLTRHSRSRKG